MGTGKVFALMLGMGLVGGGETLLLEHFGGTPNNIFRLGVTYIALGFSSLIIAIYGQKINKWLKRK